MMRRRSVIILFLAFWQQQATPHPVALRTLIHQQPHYRPLACIGSAVSLCLAHHPPPESEPPFSSDDKDDEGDEPLFSRNNTIEEGPSETTTDELSTLFLGLCFPPYASSSQNVVFQFLRAVAPPRGKRMGAFVAYIRRSVRAQGRAKEEHEHTSNKTFIPNAFFHHGDVLHF